MARTYMCYVKERKRPIRIDAKNKKAAVRSARTLGYKVKKCLHLPKRKKRR